MNSMTFAPDTYNNNMKKMWEDITKTLQILIKNDYETKCYSDGYCVAIEYDYNKNKGYGNPVLEWIGEDEYIAKWSEEKEKE